MTEKTSIFKKVSKIVLLSIFYLVIAILLLFSISTLARKKQDEIPNIFGLGYLAVDKVADSMVGDNKDSFNPNDLVIVHVLSDREKEKLDLKKLYEEKTVISFYDPNVPGKTKINTHRIYEYDEELNVVRTKGDNKNNVDDMYLEANDIIAIYKTKVAGLGKAVAFMQSTIGFALVVILPMFLLLIFQGYHLIKNIYRVKEEKLKENLVQDRELERERIKKELLEELRKESEGKTK